MIKWTEEDVIKAFAEAIQPKGSKEGNGRVLIEQMKRMARLPSPGGQARKGQIPKPETMMETTR